LGLNRKLAPALVLVLIAALGVAAFPPALASTPNFWVTKTPMPNSTGFHPGAAAVLDGKVYVVAHAQSENSAQINVYDTENDTWTKITQSPPTVNAYYCIAVCQNRIYVISPDYNPGSSQNQVYDPSTATWTTKAPLPEIADPM
jgi:hypothetical protein